MHVDQGLGAVQRAAGNAQRVLVGQQRFGLPADVDLHASDAYTHGGLPGNDMADAGASSSSMTALAPVSTPKANNTSGLRGDSAYSLHGVPACADTESIASIADRLRDLLHLRLPVTTAAPCTPAASGPSTSAPSGMKTPNAHKSAQGWAALTPRTTPKKYKAEAKQRLSGAQMLPCSPRKRGPCGSGWRRLRQPCSRLMMQTPTQPRLQRDWAQLVCGADSTLPEVIIPCAAGKQFPDTPALAEGCEKAQQADVAMQDACIGSGMGGAVPTVSIKMASANTRGAKAVAEAFVGFSKFSG